MHGSLKYTNFLKKYLLLKRSVLNMKTLNALIVNDMIIYLFIANVHMNLINIVINQAT